MPPMHAPLEIRGAVPADAGAISDLSAQLGYGADAATIARRLRDAEADANRVVVVGCVGGVVIAWMEVRVTRAMESGAWAEITGLVVDAAQRNAGIGAAHVQWAIAWARERGQARLRVRSNVVRTDAARFYTRLGFRETKQQRVLDRPLT